jgi:hypothetical protein
MMRYGLYIGACLVAAATNALAQHDADRHAAMQQRGEHAMGFDQERSTHHFRLEKSGGAIEVTAKDPADSALVGDIRGHLRHIRSAFGDGDFALPVFIHDKPPPGIAVLKARRDRLALRYEDLPAGGRVRVTTADADALAALHAFLRFQITEHKTGDPLVPR